MISMERLGSAYCPKCQERVEISDLSDVIIEYPRGANKIPTARVNCEECGTLIISGCAWEDARKFDDAGAQVEGFSFSRGPVLTEEEIDAFVIEMDTEIKQFLKDSHVKA
jgi:endogenous inhibitor of DNA gyrase (YacG/DUF329 family)